MLELQHDNGFTRSSVSHRDGGSEKVWQRALTAFVTFATGTVAIGLTTLYLLVSKAH